MSILNGIKGLLSSKKGTLSLIVLAVSAILAAVGKLDGTAWAASMTVVSGVYCFTQSRIDGAYAANQVSATTTVVTNNVAPGQAVVTPNPPVVTPPVDPTANQPSGAG